MPVQYLLTFGCSIPPETRANIQRRLSSEMVTRDVFDVAVKHVVALMREVLLPKFLGALAPQPPRLTEPRRVCADDGHKCAHEGVGARDRS